MNDRELLQLAANSLMRRAIILCATEIGRRMG